MLIADKLIYLELHKTGSTHTLKILKELFTDQYKVIGKHNSFKEVPPQVLGHFEAKLKVGNIRNPWDWYVSLWAFGCKAKGGLHQRLTNQNKLLSPRHFKHIIRRSFGQEFRRLSPKLWSDLYSDVNNFENFKKWLFVLLDKQNHSVGESYKEHSLAPKIGFLTYRYLKLYSDPHKLRKLNSYSEIKDYAEDEIFLDYIIRNECINEDVLDLAKKINLPIDFVRKVLNGFHTRTNTSKRNREYQIYYDDETKSLVETKEAFIINKYGYHFSQLSQVSV